MICSFKSRATEMLFVNGEVHSQWQSIASTARRKLDLLDAAISVEVLRFPPGNRLEKLRGDRDGQWSIRINERWRICFHWGANGPEDVEIVDYH